MEIVAFESLWSHELKQLLAPGLILQSVDSSDALSRDAALARADVLITPRFTAEMGTVCKRLRLLVCPSAGTDQIERTALPPGANVVNGSGHEIAMAEYVIGACVALRQHLLEGNAALRRGQWRYGYASGNGMLDELWGSHLGMLGFGRVAAEVTSRAAAFGMQCAAVTLHPQRSRPGREALEFLGALTENADVDRLVSWADELVLCCELSAITLGLMDARRFGLMKPTAVLINVARGALAVERDLYEALAGKRIAGAALDVWYHYPETAGRGGHPSTLPFWELDNVIMTPHASGWTHAAKRRRLLAMAKVINDFAAGSL